ncbi:MAG: hypothetical protein JOZ02_24170 [Acidobacteria bacterium]|nr:hypothetical protein [Acidobacteriota bacterium]
MARLIVSAKGSPLFGNFLMSVSVSSNEGVPTTGLKPANFQVAQLASLNHASAEARVVSKATESPAGFYILELQHGSQPALPAGSYVFAVAVTHGSDHGQTVADGDIPK